MIKMKMKKLFLLLPAFFIFLAKDVLAHCPLCTIGAAAVAGGAVYMGVSQIAIGLFIGAFAISIGWWVANLIKKQYVPYQKTLIILFSFATTIWPLLAIMKGFYPFSIFIAGDYGSLLNRTYLINTFLIGSIIGGAIVSISPWISKNITRIRNGKTLPFQGILLTFFLLIIAGTLIEVII